MNRSGSRGRSALIAVLSLAALFLPLLASAQGTATLSRAMLETAADQIADFFPSAPQDVWKFLERNSGAIVTVKYTAKPVGTGKAIELTLTGLPDHVNPAFFDQLTLTGAGLQLNRIRLTKGPVNISQPLLITINPAESNQVALFFPKGSVSVLNDRPPFAGKVTSKKVTALSGQKKRFEVRVVSTARGGEQVFRVTMQFETGRGLTDYQGDMGGIFFVYERQT